MVINALKLWLEILICTGRDVNLYRMFSISNTMNSALSLNFLSRGDTSLPKNLRLKWSHPNSHWNWRRKGGRRSKRNISIHGAHFRHLSCV